METAIDQIQIALFINDFHIKNPGELAGILLETQLIERENLIVNSFLAENAPSEFVRIEANLKSNDSVRLLIAQSKISIYFNNKKNEPNFLVKYQDIENIINKLLDCLVVNKNTFNRIGFITQMYRIIKNPITLLTDKINFKDNKKLKNADLRLTYETTFKYEAWKSLKFNKYIIIRNGVITKENTKHDVLSIQYDLNTHQSQKLTWQKSEALKFIQEAHERSASPLAIYNEYFKK